jgi:anaerobic selenocysteine-containing dehydrogenase
MMNRNSNTVYRTCSLCEACCGLAIRVEDNRVVQVTPDAEDVFSRGFVCPKGIAIGEIQNDPDRLKTPLRRSASGDFEEISWDEALAITGDRLAETRRRHGADAVAIYYGNPIIHNHGALIMRKALLDALGTRNVFSAGSQDTSPRFATSYYLYGSSLVTPVPDLDRCDYFFCVGANPIVSNGSAMTAPNVRARLRAIQQRGGKVVVVDPRLTETANLADEHVAIRPGGDAALLLAMVRLLVDHGRVQESYMTATTEGWPEVLPRLRRLDLEAAAASCGVPLATIERLALEFADAPAAVAYSRVGTCNNRHGTLATYATDLLNIATIRLGREGGWMFPTPAFDPTMITRLPGGDGHGRWHSRVRGLPETLGDLPSACLAEEIETPGDGQIRALLTFAGNPVLSTPNGRRLATSLPKLDFMVSIDLYVNETTRHADIILPSAWTLTEDHVDLLVSSFAVRNFARWSPPVIAPAPGERADWEILLAIVRRLGGGPSGVPVVDRAITALEKVGYRWHPTKLADYLLRLGPHGDRFLPWSRGLNLRKLRRAPHGIDLGPLEPGLSRIRNRGGRARLAPAPLMAAFDRLLEDQRQSPGADEVLLIGRRELRTCNSWIHNAPSMVSGRDRCLLFVHPEDAERAGLADGGTARLESKVHSGNVKVHVTNQMRPGVVSLPHGWGHAETAPWQRVASAHPGVSANDWTDDQDVELVVGQSILNGVPVRLSAAP